MCDRGDQTQTHPPNFIEITTMQHIALQRLSAET
jgi:hypothetical protein